VLDRRAIPRRGGHREEDEEPVGLHAEGPAGWTEANYRIILLFNSTRRKPRSEHTRAPSREVPAPVDGDPRGRRARVPVGWPARARARDRRDRAVDVARPLRHRPLIPHARLRAWTGLLAAGLHRVARRLQRRRALGVSTRRGARGVVNGTSE